MSEAEQVLIAFAVLGVVTSLMCAVLAAWVQHLNNVIRDLRFDLQEAADECDWLEDRLKETDQ